MSSHNLLSALLHNPYVSECIYNTSWLSLVSAAIFNGIVDPVSGDHTLSDLLANSNEEKYYFRKYAATNILYVTVERLQNIRNY